MLSYQKYFCLYRPASTSFREKWAERLGRLIIDDIAQSFGCFHSVIDIIVDLLSQLFLFTNRSRSACFLCSSSSVSFFSFSSSAQNCK
ncbi:hypothetical protein PUN28_009211 [Cardiocondyla obscurior]|uniref:Uncharacterized protein n=1 Tax=Cardiocondyla obscurior TaxID=286306 RepID=A0AAW2FUG9_9HYME